MLQFLKHKKFWIPCVTLLVLFVLTELILRLGWYNRWVKPNSFLGNVFSRVEAIEKLGLNKIDWITVGSSRMDWGIDHGMLAKAQKQKGLNHVRLSFGSGHFPTFQASIDWSIENMNSLQGVLVGANENTFSHFNIINNLFKVGWPFKNHMDFEQYKPLVESQYKYLPLYQLAWTNYFDDIKDFLRNPSGRLAELNSAEKLTEVLSYRKKNPRNLCAHPLKTIQECVDSVDAVNTRLLKNKGFRDVHRICGQANVKLRAQQNKPNITRENHQILVKNWVKLIKNVTQKGINFTLVLFPEHESLNYIYKPANGSEITNQILKEVSGLPHFSLLDLRQLLDDKENCEYFSDPHHLNNKGINLVTQAVIQHYKSRQ